MNLFLRKIVAKSRLPLSLRVANLAFSVRKMLFHSLKPARPGDQKIIFIIGCQRSGTGMLSRIFRRDFHSRVFQERSVLSSDDHVHKIRLNALPALGKIFEKIKTRLVIAKPLVETQNIPEILDYFPNARAIWIYRHYKDVCASNLRNFGLENGISNLKPIIENDQNNWRAQKVPAHIRSLVVQFFSEDMNPHDAAALFWLVRNSFFFELDLYQRKDISMIKYEDLVQQPSGVMEHFYREIEIPYPGKKLVKEVRASSLGKGSDVLLSEEIEHLCEALLEKMNIEYNKTGYKALVPVENSSP